MHAGIIFFLVILGSILFHIFTPWYWTDIASNWGSMDDTITLTFWVGGGAFSKGKVQHETKKYLKSVNILLIIIAIVGIILVMFL